MAFFVQTLIPAGFMPDFSAHAATPLVICSGMDMKTIYVDQDGKPVEKTTGQHAKPCVFAAVTTAPPAPVLHVAQPDSILLAQTITALHEQALRSDLSLRPPAIGPPAL